MKTSISLKPKLVLSRNPVRTGALEKKSPEEVAGCSSCLTGHQGREEVRRDTPSTPLFLQTSIRWHCSPLVKSNNEPASKEVWVMPSARVNFAAHRKGQKREKNRSGCKIVGKHLCPAGSASVRDSVSFSYLEISLLSEGGTCMCSKVKQCWMVHAEPSGLLSCLHHPPPRAAWNPAYLFLVAFLSTVPSNIYVEAGPSMRHF